jgi:hypothetical protein
MKIWDSQPRSRVKPVLSGSVPAVPTEAGDEQILVSVGITLQLVSFCSAPVSFSQ